MSPTIVRAPKLTLPLGPIAVWLLRDRGDVGAAAAAADTDTDAPSTAGPAEDQPGDELAALLEELYVHPPLGSLWLCVVTKNQQYGSSLTQPSLLTFSPPPGRG